MPKPCQNCQKSPATVHLTEIQDNRMAEVHLCQECADEKGYKLSGGAQKFSIGDLLANMVDGMTSTDEEKIGPVECPSCGMHFTMFRDTGRLGCPDCYTTFGSKLKKLLRRIHGSTTHVGKLPTHDGAQVSQQRQLQRLHAELQRAVESEEFERAAELRDRVKTLEREVAAKSRPEVA